MKYSFAVACLLGVISAENSSPESPFIITAPMHPAWTLKSLNDHAEDANIQKVYGDKSTEDSNTNWKKFTNDGIASDLVQIGEDSESDSDSDNEDMQLQGDDSESDHSKEFYNAWNAVKDEEEGYHRAIPAHFSGDSDDLFMRSMCKTYALEGKNKDGSPNGNFVMDEATTRAAASEVLGTHKGLSGDAKKKYLDTYFPRTFAHFDVTKGGKIEVSKMPQFMRFLASDQYMTLI